MAQTGDVKFVEQMHRTVAHATNHVHVGLAHELTIGIILADCLNSTSVGRVGVYRYITFRKRRLRKYHEYS